MHSHPFQAMSTCICNAEYHCMSFHVTCILRDTCNIYNLWITIFSPYIIHIHHRTHVNTSGKHISTRFFTQPTCHSISNNTQTRSSCSDQENRTYVLACQFMSNNDMPQNSLAQIACFPTNTNCFRTAVRGTERTQKLVLKLSKF